MGKINNKNQSNANWRVYDKALWNYLVDKLGIKSEELLYELATGNKKIQTEVDKLEKDYANS